jgi:hypothetical protein
MELSIHHSFNFWRSSRGFCEVLTSNGGMQMATNAAAIMPTVDGSGTGEPVTDVSVSEDRYDIFTRNEKRDVDTVGNTSRILSGSGLESTENATG